VFFVSFVVKDFSPDVVSWRRGDLNHKEREEHEVLLLFLRVLRALRGESLLFVVKAF
jgi:hypothetical protein